MKFVPKEKMSKKARKVINEKQRARWDIDPVTRIAGSKKKYRRLPKVSIGCVDMNDDL